MSKCSLYPTRSYPSVAFTVQISNHTLIIGLRDHLLAAQQQQPSPQQNSDLHAAQSHDAQIDPQIDTSYSPDQMDDGLEPQDPEVRKGRRELSTSKRAAQNRAAQVCFFLFTHHSQCSQLT
jgi:hypothetical protein